MAAVAEDPVAEWCLQQRFFHLLFGQELPDSMLNNFLAGQTCYEELRGLKKIHEDLSFKSQLFILKQRTSGLAAAPNVNTGVSLTWRTNLCPDGFVREWDLRILLAFRFVRGVFTAFFPLHQLHEWARSCCIHWEDHSFRNSPSWWWMHVFRALHPATVAALRRALAVSLLWWAAPSTNIRYWSFAIPTVTTF